MSGPKHHRQKEGEPIAAAAPGTVPADGASQAERILQAAATVFLEKGFDAATTLDIAACARVSKRDLYRQFASKQGMLEALIAAHSHDLAVPMTLADPVDRDHFLATLRAFGPDFLARYLDARKIALYRLAIAEAPRTARIGQSLAVAGVEPVRAAFAGFLARAVARGIVAADDTDLVLAVFFNVLIGPWHLRLLTGSHAPPDDAIRQAQADSAVEAVRRVLLAAGPSPAAVSGQLP